MKLSLEINQNRWESLSWSQTEMLLAAIPEQTWQGANLYITFDSGREAELIVVFFAPWGWNVNIVSDDEYTLADESLGAEMVVYDLLSGARQPRFCFVARSRMLETVLHFHETGQRAPHLSWNKTRDVSL